MTAIQVFLNPECGIVEDLGIEDGFVSLKISADFVCEDTLDDILFTFGALCAIFMIKAHLGPDPVSPALLLQIIDSYIGFLKQGCVGYEIFLPLINDTHIV